MFFGVIHQHVFFFTNIIISPPPDRMAATSWTAAIQTLPSEDSFSSHCSGQALSFPLFAMISHNLKYFQFSLSLLLREISPWFPTIPNIFTFSPQGNFPMIFQNPKSFQFSLYLLKGNLCWERVWRSWRLWEVKCRKELRNIRDSISNIDFYLCASRFV